MTLIELYVQLYKHYNQEDEVAFLTLLQGPTELLSESEITTLLPWVIMDDSSRLLHLLLKALLLKTKGVFKLDEPIVDDLTALDILSKSGNNPNIDPNIVFTKKMMLYYAACWDYFVGEVPTVDNIHQFPPFFSLAQEYTVPNIEHFLNLQAEKTEKNNDPSVKAVKAEGNIFFTKRGLCEGLCFFSNLHDAQGKLEYYRMTIAWINIWNRSATQLNKPLPAILPQALFYPTLEKLFIHWTSYILLFHDIHVNKVLLNSNINSHIDKSYSQLPGVRSRYFRLAKSEQMNARMIVIEDQAKLNKIMCLTQAQFDEYLMWFSQMPAAYTHISKNGHMTSIIKKDEQINPFDSNDSNISPNLASLENLKEFIQRAHPILQDEAEYQFLLVYRYEGPGYKKPWEQGSIFAELPKTFEAMQKFREGSANKLTHLHVAVLVQDTKTIQEILKILKQENINALVPDFHGRYAIDIAIENAYWEGVELLLSDPNIEFYRLSWSMMNMLIIYEHEDFIVRLLQHEKIRCDFDKPFATVLKISIAYNGEKIIQDIRKLFSEKPENDSLVETQTRRLSVLLNIIEILFALHEELFAKDLFIWMTQRIDKSTLDILLNTVLQYSGFDEKITLLHKAIITGNDAYVKFLIEKGTDLKTRIEGGLNHGKTAYDLLVEYGQLELIPENERKLKDKIQLSAKNAYRYFNSVDERVEKQLLTLYSSYLRFGASA